MKHETVLALTGTFESHAQETEGGIEFWLARDLQHLLGYTEWRNFTTVISKAKTACEVSGHDISDHFVEVNKLVDIGSGGTREIDDIMLTRYACYLIAQNGDPKKEQIAFAQTYFAVQTRKAEIIEQRLLEAERVSARQKLTATEKELSSVIYQQTGGNRNFGLIRSKGDQALFGKSTQAMKSHWRVPDKRPLADFAPTIILKAKDFATEITIHNAREHRLSTERQISDEHVTNNQAVRRDASKRETDLAIAAEEQSGYGYGADDFAAMILENLKTSGVQQAHKDDKITFTSIAGWPGRFICAEGRYLETGEGGSENGEEGGTERRAGIFIGPEFGTVQRQDLVAAARECGDADFDVLVACAFNYEAHASEFNKLGRIPVLKARMNADLHMAGELKETDKANLFVIFGEPDIDILPVPPSPSGRGAGGEGERIQVKINGVDVFHPQTGKVKSDDADGIACWFIDTDYNEESFFVRHAYFLGASDPYKSLKTTLKAEINEEAWESLHSDTSRPFDKPSSGRIAVKVINHLGDEVMKVFRVE